MEKKKLQRHLPLIIGGGLVVVLVIVGYFAIQSIDNSPEQKKVVQQITVLKPPPPPPEPPPEEEPPPPEEEEPIEEDVPEEPEAMPDEGADEPAGEELGVDADASAGGDSFGLKAKRGGRGLLGVGGYAAALKTEINKALIKDKKLSQLEYVAIVTLWVDSDGSFSDFRIDMREGNNRTREKLEAFLSRMGGSSKSKPLAEKNNVFKFRIRSVI